MESFHFPLANVWLGVSVEDQRRADERIPLLLQTPAAVRFLSCEPLLGELNIRKYLSPQWTRELFTSGGWEKTRDAIDWVIVGGESGPHYRGMDLDWARKIRDDCVGAAVPFFYKQGSAFRSEQDTLLDGEQWHQYPNETHFEKGGETYAATDKQVA